MTKVNMNQEQFKIGEGDPQLPKEVKDACQNHMGMTVPEDFFAQFERKMNAVIDAAALADNTPQTTPTPRTFQLSRRWLSIAASVVLLVVIGLAFQFDCSKIIDQQGLMAEAPTPTEEELNPADDIYYTSLSDYEVYDLICGL